MIRLDLSEVEQLERDMRVFARDAMPFAIKSTLKMMARNSRKTAIERTIPDKMHVRRNPWMKRTTRFADPRGRSIERMQSKVGSTQEYMEWQQAGTVKRPKPGSSSVPIPTNAASGERAGVVPRRRVPRRIADDKLLHPNTAQYYALGSTPRQRRVVAMRKAIQTGRRFTFLEDYDGAAGITGIVKILGLRDRQGSRNRGVPRRLKVRPVWDYRRNRLPVEKTKWLTNAVDIEQRNFEAVYSEAMQFQLRRQGIFR